MISRVVGPALAYDSSDKVCCGIQQVSLLLQERAFGCLGAHFQISHLNPADSFFSYFDLRGLHPGGFLKAS